VPVIAVINRKGGSGKSTVATHIAAHLARGGQPVMLGDVDRQQSSRAWLRRRSRLDAVKAPPIRGWVIDKTSVARPPAGITHLVLDTPGGLTGF
jgi:chromosome partitioning protein